MLQVTVEDQVKTYEEGTRLLAVAQGCKHLFEEDILLAMVDGKLRELHKKVVAGTQIRFLTAKDTPGLETYRRSAVFIMLKAFYEVVGAERVEKVSVDFSIGSGLFMDARGDFTITPELIGQVKEKMHEYVAQELPIMKRSLSTDDAVELFQKHRMYDKAKLFYYRRGSKVNVYKLGGFEDYYFGYMVQNTGYIRYFDLVPYQHGFVLLLPGKDSPRTVPPLMKREKLFTVLKQSSQWGEKLQIVNVGELNATISKGGINELILVQEALQEKMMGEIAGQIAQVPDKKLIMVAGPSSSGKTTFSHRLSIQLRAQGLRPHPIAVDNYFVNRVDSPKDEDGNYNYEALECLDIELFNRDMGKLLAGETVELPRYNFVKGEREYKGDTLALGKGDILVIEGIHCLNGRLTHSLPDSSKFRIYISALTQLNIDEHNRIPTTDGRLLRRIIRDARTRGNPAQETIRMWPSVRRGEEENIFPFQEDADVMFNSALVYELAILKQYAEPLLFGIPKDSEEYLEAKRLLKFLDYFLGVSSEDIPRNSILREFIGNSCFKV